MLIGDMRSRLVAVVCGLVASLGFAWNAQAQDLGGLDGQWDGTLTYLQGPGLSKVNAPGDPLRLVINGASARVYYFRDNVAKEVKPGAFRVERLRVNAIVFAIDSARDEDGIWVETWSFTVTLKDRDTLIANWYRVVNNINVPLTNEHSKFSVAATGEMRRAR